MGAHREWMGIKSINLMAKTFVSDKNISKADIQKKKDAKKKALADKKKKKK